MSKSKKQCNHYGCGLTCIESQWHKRLTITEYIKRNPPTWWCADWLKTQPDLQTAWDATLNADFDNPVPLQWVAEYLNWVVKMSSIGSGKIIAEKTMTAWLTPKHTLYPDRERRIQLKAAFSNIPEVK